MDSEDRLAVSHGVATVGLRPTGAQSSGPSKGPEIKDCLTVIELCWQRTCVCKPIHTELTRHGG